MSATFALYIEDCAKQIRKLRSLEYQGNKLEQVIKMSLPFELKTTPYPKKGILLSHGFLASPYIMRSLAEDFAQAGFLVRAILLPGHGTNFKELDHYTWQDWLATVRFGYESLSNDCEEIYLCGFSAGATLSLILALELLANNRASALKKLILIAPCFKLSGITKSFPWLIKNKLTKFLPQLFCTQAEKEHLASYTKFSIKSVGQIIEMLQFLKQQLTPYQKNKFPLPTYVIASHEDATVKFTATMDFVNTYLTKNSYFWIYSTKVITNPIAVPSSLIKAQNLKEHIKAISHVAIPVAPTDLYFGINGGYYGKITTKVNWGEPRFMQRLKRLTYNPDYTHLQTHIFSWLQEK
jgi:esterase/lipase